MKYVFNLPADIFVDSHGDLFSLAFDGSRKGSKGNTVQAETPYAVTAPATVSGEIDASLRSLGNREDRHPSATRESGDLPSLVQPISGGGVPMVSHFCGTTRDRAVFSQQHARVSCLDF
jgi:hypothetical protein